MKTANLPFVVLLVLFLAIPLFSQASGKVFTVNSVSDTSDAEPGDRVCADANGQCTLRAAIQEANTHTGDRDIIMFSMAWPAVINLTQGLTITAPNVAIVGPGARRLTVQRSPDQTLPFRIFTIPNAGTTAVIRALTIRNGLAGQLLTGGGLWVRPGAALMLYDSAVLNNSAGTGGGIANEGSLTVTRSLIASNIAGFQGGGIHSSTGSTTRIVNSTVTENQSPTGGGIWNAGTMLLVNNTVSHNAATSNARSIFNENGGSAHVLNTIIGSDDSSTPVSMSGAFTSLGNNIVTDARTSTGFTNGVNNDQVSDKNSINPLLGPLSDNGGQTDTRALQSGSTAIDAANGCVRDGSCSLPPGPPVFLRSDQRLLYFRPFVGNIDIGAFEFGANPVGGVGTFSGGFSSSNGQHLGSIVVLTDTETNQKQYAVMGPFGRYRFQTFRPGVVYIQEIISKRQSLLLPSPWLLPLFD